MSLADNLRLRLAGSGASLPAGGERAVSGKINERLQGGWLARARIAALSSTLALSRRLEIDYFPADWKASWPASSPASSPAELPFRRFLVAR